MFRSFCRCVLARFGLQWRPFIGQTNCAGTRQLSSITKVIATKSSVGVVLKYSLLIDMIASQNLIYIQAEAILRLLLQRLQQRWYSTTTCDVAGGTCAIGPSQTPPPISQIGLLQTWRTDQKPHARSASSTAAKHFQETHGPALGQGGVSGGVLRLSFDLQEIFSTF